MKQQSIMLNANCQLIQCTHITDLLSNLKILLDSMNIKVFIAMRNVSCSQMVQNTSQVLLYIQMKSASQTSIIKALKFT